MAGFVERLLININRNLHQPAPTDSKIGELNNIGTAIEHYENFPDFFNPSLGVPI